MRRDTKSIATHVLLVSTIDYCFSPDGLYAGRVLQTLGKRPKDTAEYKSPDDNILNKSYRL